MKKVRSTSRKEFSVLIVDDHPMMRQGLAQLIEDEPDLRVCGEAENAAAAMEVARKVKPDLVLVDITLPGRNGLELIKDLQTLDPNIRVLVISMHEESLYAERVLKAGGRGYIMKHEGAVKLREAIRQVISGQIYVSPRISGRLLEGLAGHGRRRSSSPIESLTDREFEIFQLLGSGRSTREIAGLLHLSIKTVEVHRANIKKKLKIQSAPELIHYAVRWMESEQRA